MNRFRWFVVFFFAFLSSRAARADELTVDVRPAAASLDAEALRRGIAEELRDAHASGTLVVDVEANELVVTYGKLTRRVAMPADPAEARKTAIALAGNLARDEAGELAAALAKRPTGPAPPRPGAKTRAAEPEPFPETASLRASLAVHAARERRFRRGMGLTLVALGSGSLTLGAILVGHDDTKVGGAYAISGGTLLLLDGIMLYAFRSTYERLSEDPNSTEEDWIREAASEHSWRKVSAIMNIVVGGAFVGTGTFILANKAHASATERETAAAIAFGFGIGGVIAGIWRLSTPGPLESGLKDWQTAIRPDVAVVPGGAVGSVALSF
jgi:hypothetical protein